MCHGITKERVMGMSQYSKMIGSGRVLMSQEDVSGGRPGLTG